MRYIAITLLLMTFSSWAFSASAADRFEIQLPSSWKAAPGIFGLEEAYLGPESNGARPALSVTELKLTSHKLAPDLLKKNSAEYLQDRKAWVESRRGEFISEIPMENFEWAPTTRGVSIGVRYRMGQREFVERSYLAECRSGLFHLKSLLPTQTPKAQEEEALKVFRSFRCK